MPRSRADSRKNPAKALLERPRKRRKAASALDLDALAPLLGVHLRMANVVLYQDFVSAVKPLDLTQRQSAVLILIGTNPGASQIALAEFLGINRATMMAMVNRLQARGLLERRDAKSDKRLKALHLTRKGRTTLAELKRRIVRHERKTLDHFSADELDQFREYLSRVHGKF